MNVTPSEADWELARSVGNEFRPKPGSEYIASDFALAHLSAVLNAIRPDSVLEFGAGIGTITYFLMKHPVSIGHLTTIENHPFCLAQFAANIPAEFEDRYELVNEIGDVAPGARRYDLVIVDHTVGKEGCALFEQGVVCFVEGARGKTRQLFNAELGERGLRCDLTNYDRERRNFSLSIEHCARSGLPYPKIRFPRTIKGCGIGVVEPIGT